MIKIPISEKQSQEIEKIYWDWISRYHLSNLLDVIEKDTFFKKLIMENEKDLISALKKYLFAKQNEITRIKLRIEKMRLEKQCIKESTKEYLKARYENYRDSQAAKIVNVLDITVCPYCNQNHINVSYEKNGKIRLWGDLDHFYDKSRYPELSICVYNLIPVCKVCNQLKSSQKRVIVSPYNLEKKTNIKFKTEFDANVDLDYLQGKSQNFNIVIDDTQLTEEDKEEIELFDLANRYKQLKQNVQEIIIKSRAYDGMYKNLLKESFELTDDELKAYIFGYTENHLNRVLSKFNLDIMNEFSSSDK